MIFRAVIILFFVCGGFVVSAQTDTSGPFLIHTLVGEDAEAPTTPTILSAVPLTTTQIDIAWSTSTDNFSFGGYRVFRDGSQIATTTQTSYSDTGLTASTTYTYEVNAYDNAGNTSSTSAAVSTTTLSVATPEETVEATTTTNGSNISSASGRVILTDLTITTQTKSAQFVFETSAPSRFQLRWGRTSVYDGGYVATDIYRFIHKTLLTDLEPGTRYEYELIGYNDAGRAFPLKTGTFTTDEAPDTTPPLNVQNLRAEVVGNDVLLSWEVPPGSDIESVRVMRSYMFYPAHPNDGFFSYQGDNISFYDPDALRQYETQYYTVFSYDKNGNVSSGVIVAASLRGVFVVPPAGDGTSGLPGTQASGSAPIDEGYLSLSPDQVFIKQGTRLMDFGGGVELLVDKSFVVSVPFEAVPPHLKSIVFDIYDTSGEEVVQSYLLRINKDKTEYQAVVPGISMLGETAWLRLHVFDHWLRDTSTVSTQATLTVSSPVEVVKRYQKVLFSNGTLLVISLLGITLLILLLFLLLLILKRRKRDADEDKPQS